LRQLHSEKSATVNLASQLSASEKQLVYVLCVPVVKVKQDGLFPSIGHVWGKHFRTRSVNPFLSTRISRDNRFSRSAHVEHRRKHAHHHQTMMRQKSTMLLSTMLLLTMLLSTTV
jgi:hypothetical protein